MNLENSFSFSKDTSFENIHLSNAKFLKYLLKNVDFSNL